jgi:glutamate dehydrogenase/leucine dehydrogenase
VLTGNVIELWTPLRRLYNRLMKKKPDEYWSMEEIQHEMKTTMNEASENHKKRKMSSQWKMKRKKVFVSRLYV